MCWENYYRGCFSVCVVVFVCYLDRPTHRVWHYYPSLQMKKQNRKDWETCPSGKAVSQIPALWFQACSSFCSTQPPAWNNIIGSDHPGPPKESRWTWNPLSKSELQGLVFLLLCYPYIAYMLYAAFSSNECKFRFHVRIGDCTFWSQPPRNEMSFLTIPDNLIQIHQHHTLPSTMPFSPPLCTHDGHFLFEWKGSTLLGRMVWPEVRSLWVDRKELLICTKIT